MRFKARTFLLLLSLVAACAVSSPAQTTQKPADIPRSKSVRIIVREWREFTSAEGGFTVSMPAEPKVSTQRLPPPHESVTMRTHIAETEAEYGVAYADYPEQIEGTDKVGPFFAAVRDEGVKGVGGRLLEDREESFDGHPGRVYRFEYAGGYQIRCRLFVVVRRLYMVTASTYGTKARDEQARRTSETAADKFMASFKLHRIEDGARQRLPAGDPNRQAALSSNGEVDRLLRSLPEGSVLAGFCTAKFCRKQEGSVVEFKVLKNPAPDYPAIAHTARARGEVVVRIVADEEGRVVAAQAVGGHPLLQQSAAAAARRMRVSPVTSKDGAPSKVSGVVVYTFVLR